MLWPSRAASIKAIASSGATAVGHAVIVHQIRFEHHDQRVDFVILAQSRWLCVRNFLKVGMNPAIVHIGRKGGGLLSAYHQWLQVFAAAREHLGGIG